MAGILAVTGVRAGALPEAAIIVVPDDDLSYYLTVRTNLGRTG